MWRYQIQRQFISLQFQKFSIIWQFSTFLLSFFCCLQLKFTTFEKLNRVKNIFQKLLFDFIELRNNNKILTKSKDKKW